MSLRADLFVSPSVTIDADHLTWSAVRSSGPGGQNVNKVSSKVDLRFDLPASNALSYPQKQRLRQVPGIRLDAEGRVQLVCDETRDQHRNLELARERLAELIRRILTPPKPRRATKPTRGSVRRRLEGKKKQASKKAQRKPVSND